MGLSINQNIMAINSYRNLSTTQTGLSKSLEKLSSGYRINRAGDDAAGLAISEGLRAQVRGTQQAARNAQDGISLVQTSEGALNEVHDILQRMRELTVQAGNDTNDANARTDIATELGELGKEIKRIADSTSFAGQQVLKGGSGFTFQVGANGGNDTAGAYNATASNTIKIDGIDLMAAVTADIAKADGTGTGLDVTDNGKANASLAKLDTAIQNVSTKRAVLGAAQNRLEHTINNLNVAHENLSASESRIRDTDMASEMMKFTRNQILSQAGTAMLAQANQVPQGVLSLLR